MIVQVGNGGIAPAIASAALTTQVEFVAHQAVSVFRQTLGHIYREAMSKVCLGIVSTILQMLHCLAGSRSHGDDLKSHDIDSPAVNGGIVIGQAEPLAVGLARTMEASDLLKFVSFLPGMKVVDYQFIATRLAGEVAVDHAWLKIALLAGFA